MYKASYSALDKLLHRVAFASDKMQTVLAELEDDLYRKQIAAQTIQAPVFIAALPRAGTTTLLELCVATRAFTSHTYRQMPFIHVPLLWHKFAQRFAANQEKHERAHGDGIYINVDSPEAFEEVIWKSFWKTQYQPSCIEPWQETANVAFDTYFKRHICKLLTLGNQPGLRYLSKNNLNIARLSYLAKLFDDAVIVVLFREPANHALSLHNQHLRFCSLHEKDGFARQYMADIGHFDFGLNLRPINFAQWFEQRQNRDNKDVFFWLEYWLNSYRYLLSHTTPALHFVSYDRLCENPTTGLEQLAGVLRLNEPRALINQAEKINKPAIKTLAAESPAQQSLLNEASALYAQLCERSII